MKILIISDSHGWTDELADVIAQQKPNVSAIFHCGDSELPHHAPQLENCYVVRGNCDFDEEFPEERVEEIEGTRVYMTHGHLYNVKMSHVPITYRAEEVGANIACFGHSHVATSFSENNVVYINPGSIRLPRNRKEQTYCICEINENREVTVTFYDRTGKDIPDLTSHYLIGQD
ncbi:metallophosphoesterase family protein [Desertibacillus haloalkaliphilus]|uniref:metallophosphoesterase family protein n=1 Tax=Desertibacillus haloalkaliphilus TaxID=1328930 RepID=UPI001C265EAD|nr:metallophosphoesterase [Desertibacillus haloalkaliphilus]MBU8905088.1 metallophosphoesterase [Desertibacillus haloalkaliphilus]